MFFLDRFSYVRFGQPGPEPLDLKWTSMIPIVGYPYQRLWAVEFVGMQFTDADYKVLPGQTFNFPVPIIVILDTGRPIVYRISQKHRNLIRNLQGAIPLGCHAPSISSFRRASWSFTRNMVPV